MGKAIGSWLSGPQAAREGGDTEEWRGQRLGLPREGAGSVAGFGRRLLAFFVDNALAVLLALAWGYRPASGDGYGVVVLVAFLLMELVFVGLAGQTIGMRLLGIRVARLDGGRPSWGWTAVRTLLLALAVPPLVIDRANRGLHDRAAGVVVVRS